MAIQITREAIKEMIKEPALLKTTRSNNLLKRRKKEYSTSKKRSKKPAEELSLFGFAMRIHPLPCEIDNFQWLDSFIHILLFTRLTLSA